MGQGGLVFPYSFPYKSSLQFSHCLGRRDRRSLDVVLHRNCNVRVSQNFLYHFVRHAKVIKGCRNSAPEPMPTVPGLTKLRDDMATRVVLQDERPACVAGENIFSNATLPVRFE